MKYVSAKDSQKYFETRTVKGTGTFTNPLVGDLRRIFESQPPNTTLQLLDGTGEFHLRAAENQTDFENRSIECFSPGLIVLGAGTYRTNIILDHHPENSSVMVYSSLGVELHDLTIDVASTGQETHSRHGLIFGGSNCLAKRVRVCGVFGNKSHGASGDEAWAFSLGTPQPGVIQRNTRAIECVAEDFLGDYVNAFDPGIGKDCVIQRCTANLPSGLDEQGNVREVHMVGINLFHHVDALIEGNKINGGSTAIYGESPFDGGIIRRNCVRDSIHGIRFLRHAVMRDCLIEENLIALEERVRGGVAIGLYTTLDGALIENVRVCRNTLRGSEGMVALDLQSTHSGDPSSTTPDRVRHVRFHDNDVTSDAIFKNCESVHFQDNHWMDGTTLDAK
jgi:hypothetical protein